MRGLVCLYVCFVCSENRIYCKKKVLFCVYCLYLWMLYIVYLDSIFISTEDILPLMLFMLSRGYLVSFFYGVTLLEVLCL